MSKNQISACLALVGFLSINSVSHATDHHAEAPVGISAGDALSTLKEGNQRFVTGKATRPHQDEARRKELFHGQKPHTIVLSCSDSRVSPEIAFDQGLGDVFVIRTAGHMVASPELASIEYAVEHLGTRLVVVMGHESCGAVKAALTAKGKSLGSPHLDALAASIQNHLRGSRSLASSSTDGSLIEPVRTNSASVVQDLLSRSAILRKHKESKGLKIVPALYRLKSGEVEFF